MEGCWFLGWMHCQFFVFRWDFAVSHLGTYHNATQAEISACQGQEQTRTDKEKSQKQMTKRVIFYSLTPELANQTVTQTANQTVNQTANQTVTQTANQTANQTVTQTPSANQTANQTPSANQTAAVSYCQSVSMSVTIHMPAEHLILVLGNKANNIRSTHRF